MTDALQLVFGRRILATTTVQHINLIELTLKLKGTGRNFDREQFLKKKKIPNISSLNRNNHRIQHIKMVSNCTTASP